ncbi:FAD/NAD(P)-binding domain-containing protein [Parathielavia appendiculata]|uniref:FAD/NAD(P)-binding domain-containing protein n=1 Tax=Parathielavia appendiculata TaxID=2587402 RepID=A0AAN6TUU9_9PEZI|nr:FAD/NAD(P)-binding domain-containing protein [Parathielavia appendiculata]
MRIFGSLIVSTVCVAATWLPEVITRDVAIIGGGASGAYAAVRLKEDFNKSIVLVEKANRLGGHVDTYKDPKTGNWYDFGVQNWNDYGPAKAFFDRMGVPVGAPGRNVLASRYADFTTGAGVNFTPPANADRVAALGRFLNATAPYEQYFLPGYWNWPAPDKIPEDLLLPFSDFVEKYDIRDSVNQVFQVTGMGVGDMSNALTLYVLGAFGPPMMRAFLGQGASFTPDTRRNIALYEAIQTRLGANVLLSTVVTSSIRTNLGHTLYTKSADGKARIIIARKLLMAIEPTPANMEPFSLDQAEQSVFSKFKFSTVQAGIVAHPSLPINGTIINTPAAAAPNNYLVLPKPDFVVRFDHMGGGSDLFRVLVVGAGVVTVQQAQDMVRQDLARLIAAGTLPATADPAALLEFRAWADHGGMHMHASAKELRDGFVQKLYALQGRRGTWWTGGAFSVQFQSILWAYDDVLLPKMLA